MLTAPLPQHTGGISPHNVQRGFRSSSAYHRPYIIKEPHYTFDIGQPIERPDSDNPIGDRLARNVEECQINAIWNNLKSCLRCPSGDHRSIVSRDDTYGMHSPQNMTF